MQCFWFVQPLLSGKDLYLVLVHEGGTGKACCFQLAQLLAELLALRQDGDVVGIAQGSGPAQDGGKVGVLAVEQCDLLLCAGDLITLLEQDAADALEADGEADCRHLRAEELAHHVVIAAAAGDCAAELRAGNFEDHAGVVALTAHEAGAVGHLIAACGHGVGSSEDVLEVVGDGGVCAAGGHSIQRHLAGGDEVGQCVDRALGQLLLEKLGLHAVGTDLIHLVEGDADGIQRVGGKAHALQHPAEDAAVVDVDGEAVEADAQQGAGGHVDELDLGVGALVAQNVDVALDELAQTALLGALGAEDAVGLDDLEGVGELVLVGGVEAAQGQGQVIAQTHVGELFRVAGVQGGGELVAALEHFEDEVQVVAAVGLVEVFHILQHGGGDALEAGCAVSLENFALNVVAQGLLVGQKVAHTF